MLVDNGSANVNEIEGLANSKITVVKLPRNMGLCTGLNRGIAVAKKMGSAWVLLLDQDSVLQRGAVEKVLGEYGKIPEKVKAPVGMISITYLDKDKDRRARQVPENKNFLYKVDTILSGSLVKSEVFNLIKFREDFFTDMLDFEFDLNLQKHGYEIIEYDAKLMSHQFGKPVIRNGKKIRYYNEKRLYYVTRNSTYLLLHYNFSAREHVSMILTLYSRFIRVRGLEGIWPMSVAFALGTADGIAGHMGASERYRL